MKGRSIEAIRDEIIADRDIGVTVGQLADQLGQGVLEQILAEGAHMLMRGSFGGYDIETSMAAIAYAFEDQLPTILSGFHQSLSRDVMVRGASLLKEPHGGFTGGGFDDIVSRYVELAKQLASEFPDAGVVVPNDATQKIFEWAKRDAFFISDYMIKQIQGFERGVDPSRLLPEWHKPEWSRKSFGYGYLRVFDSLMNGELV